MSYNWKKWRDFQTQPINLNEAVDEILQSIGNIAKNKELLNMGTELKKLFGKKNVEFIMLDMIPPHYRIKHKGKTIIVINKSNVSGAELIVKNVAIGYE